MENSIDNEDDDGGVLKFDINMTVDDFLDQYMMWRMKDTLRFESDPRVRRACHELLAYMGKPESSND